MLHFYCIFTYSDSPFPFQRHIMTKGYLLANGVLCSALILCWIVLIPLKSLSGCYLCNLRLYPDIAVKLKAVWDLFSVMSGCSTGLYIMLILIFHINTYMLHDTNDTSILGLSCQILVEILQLIFCDQKIKLNTTRNQETL